MTVRYYNHWATWTKLTEWRLHMCTTCKVYTCISKNLRINLLLGIQFLQTVFLYAYLKPYFHKHLGYLPPETHNIKLMTIKLELQMAMPELTLW